ncbi:MAG: DgaE family pyridoxal phosphate-dependent ammonia lyase [Erysipelotrichaceae bacterium]|nr:DgaE family pyridoxal phosphate-dependent ammonia lyase [Erysipelotrichaceae bacterium]
MKMNCYERIGLSRVINASGRMTALGVSTISDKTARASVEGGQSYVVINDLINRAGEIISTYTKAEDSCVCCSASAAIAIAVAGLISRGRKSIIERLPDSSGLPNEVILQKGHAIQFGACETTIIRLGGGVPVEVGTVNEVAPEDIEEAINEKTVCLMYVKSHHCVQEGMVSFEKMLEIAHRNNLPLLVDAAAEEDFEYYIAKGADLVCYSGAKALEATTSGFVTGKREYIDWCKKQYIGIGRAMKVGKEQIMGLLSALDQYYNKDMESYVSRQHVIVDYLVEELNKIPNLTCSKLQDDAGRDIFRCCVKVDEAKAGMTAVEIDRKLKEGNPSIHCRHHFLSSGILLFDPRPLVEGDKELIVEKMRKIMEGAL